MNEHQQMALDHPCRLAIETVHPRFVRLNHAAGVSIVLTINSGYQ